MVMVEVSAQVRIVSGTITGEDKLPIPMATISCKLDGKDYGTVSNEKGKYKLELPNCNKVTLHINHLAFEEAIYTINNRETNIVKDFRLKESSVFLDTVSITAKIPPAKQKGDTTIYIAKAYKISEDATAYDLITQKMSGISVNDGKVEVHGETVTDVMIDGKEYYKNDLVLALKNLPAYIINEVQVFDKSSDYSRLTGFEDATSRTKVLNIITKKEDKALVFGKVYGGYGLDNRYDAYGSANIISEQQTLAVFAQANNINKQDFSVLSLTDNNSSNTPQQSPYSKGAVNTFQQEEDIQERMSANLGDGLSAVTAAGFNYTNKSADGRFSLSGHYLFSNVDNNVEYNILDKYFTDSIDDMSQHIMTHSNTSSHRANFKIEYHITDHDIIMFTPVFSYQKKKTDGTTILSGIIADTMVNQRQSSDGYALLGMGELNYVHKFGNSGKALSANLRYSHQQSEEDLDMNIDQASDAFTLRRMLENGSANDLLNGTISYITTIDRASKLKFDLGWGTALLNYGTSLEQSDSLDIMHPDSTLSGMTRSKHYGINAGVAYVYSNHGLDMAMGIDGKRLTQHTENRMRSVDTAFYSALPFLKARYMPDTRNQFHLTLRSRLNTPSVSQLHETTDVIDPSLSIRGNANLLPSTSYDASFRYVFNNVESSQVFVCFAKYSIARNYIATERIFSGDASTATVFQPQLLTYKNTRELFSSADVLVAYGFPIRFIKSNANVSLLMNHSTIPGFCNNVPTRNVVTRWSGSVTIGSNISEQIDFVIDLNLQHSNDKNEEFNSLSVSYWTFSYGGQLKVHPFKWLKASVECGHTGYYGMSTNKYNALICNATASYVFGGQRQAELKLSVNDILNQNNNFTLYTTESYMRETSVNVLGRHALLTFIYNFNRKN